MCVWVCVSVSLCMCLHACFFCCLCCWYSTSYYIPPPKKNDTPTERENKNIHGVCNPKKNAHIYFTFSSLYRYILVSFILRQARRKLLDTSPTGRGWGSTGSKCVQFPGQLQALPPGVFLWGGGGGSYVYVCSSSDVLYHIFLG